MHPHPARLIAGLLALGLLTSACSPGAFSLHHGDATRISISDDGDSSIQVRRSGYSLVMECEGKATFRDDESDLATLSAGGSFELSEQLDGVLREYTVRADRNGRLVREYFITDQAAPMDDAAQKWLSEALPRMFRESGFDAEARIGRLLARGGPELVLQEVDLARSDHAKASYLGRLLETTPLDAALAVRALATAATIESDYELSRLLQEVVEHLPAGAGARAAWLAAASGLDSDYELGQAIEEGLDQLGTDAGFAAQLVALAGRHLDSDYELGQVLKDAADRGADPALAAVYLDAVGEIGSDYERRGALERIAPAVAADSDLNRRYRDLARSLGDYERGQALKALDDAMDR
jgi:hypothetical protein